MSIFQKRSAILIISVSIIAFATINFNMAMLCFMVFWQIGATVHIRKELVRCKTARSGPFILGKATELRKLNSAESETHNYEHLIEFTTPSGEKYLLHHKFSLPRPSFTTQEYKIWLNEANPQDSIVLDYFGPSWKFGMVFIAIFALIVIWPEVVYVRRLWP